MKSVLTLLSTLLLAPLAALNAAEPADTSIRSPELMFKRGDFLAMGGDSITYMSRYSVLVEMYLLAARPDLDLRVMKIQRWCGGTADVYAKETLEQELIPAKPNVFTICFGMNDGGGTKPNPDTTRRYEAALTQIVERNRANGITTVLCSPGVVDEFSYENVTLAAAAYNAANGTPSASNDSANNAPAAIYNSTLAGLRDAARGVAETHKTPFADIHDAMMRVMQDAKAGYGTTWPPRVSLRRPERRAILCDDGVHPDTAAHIPMAYSVLRAMGFDGDIGTITLDWTNGKAAADSAQTTKVVSKGRMDVESQRLPMCFFDDSAISGGYPSVPCRYVLQHCPFNQELNRYRLQVRGLPNQPIRVTWGDRSLFFTREQLENGINLAAEFPDNPFCPVMRTLDAAVWKKQVYERRLFEILMWRSGRITFPAGNQSSDAKNCEKAWTAFLGGLAQSFPRIANCSKPAKPFACAPWPKMRMFPFRNLSGFVSSCLSANANTTKRRGSSSSLFGTPSRSNRFLRADRDHKKPSISKQ